MRPCPCSVQHERRQVVGTSLAEQLARHAAVIHLRTPTEADGYKQDNPLRIENAEQARLIDDEIAHAWAQHPRRFVVEPTESFLSKAAQVIALLRDEIPECCRSHVVSALPDG